VTFQGGVYDVTSFLPLHPGGAKLLLAAGGALEPYWDLYPQHAKPHVREQLAAYRVGALDPASVAVAATPPPSDPYASDPPRHPSLQFASQRPACAEPPPELLVASYLTPQSLLFVRHHGPVPHVDADAYRLRVEGLAGHVAPRTFSLDELRASAPPASVVMALQCAGNRRAAMSAEKPTQGLAWGGGAIGNGEWRGVKLRDFLLGRCGVDPALAGAEGEGGFSHVHFEGLDAEPGGGGSGYVMSLPVEIALDPATPVLLAWEYNGEPLTREHGAPLRLVVPGVVAARQVKWLGRIALAREECGGQFQKRDYKAFPPWQTAATVDWDSAPPLYDMPVSSSIAEPREGAMVPAGAEVLVKGWAWAGGGRGVARVDVSADGGRSWSAADILDAPGGGSGGVAAKLRGAWGWTLWEARVRAPAAGAAVMQLVCKATDVAANTQPETAAAIYNWRGVANNAWARVNVVVAPSAAPALK
jgi:sulfite oxidase